MQIDDMLLNKLATLSMLEIAPAEYESLKGHLKEVLEFVDNLNQMDLEGIELKDDLKTPLREDKVVHNPQISQDILAHAPKAQEGYFIVPKIIET
ncbi:Glutamyl-tRNA(Gln) amidotransferase subunit C GatC [Helicobacter sp. NHP19-003]|uniref:Aspartyl/glutamyl-tRNA(Asn/Gln) amidotransferase subunit C n=1 Tax=Helicobacter gastrocanis TaxID=2849641 RepID=A0ABM7S9D5_9HELI|nr:Asp-tRNA(Asn)/Glu-tRNA(Gln) amidotransferase subunit GatC [Helicobacter sp. NHP19-003]BCZ17136.1 Glutamyl-tRNA(Gln) amidotransferase subunit C GatC [Helicobacter sp. NHP19-003]